MGSQNADTHQKERVIKKESKRVDAQGMKNSPKKVKAMEDKPKKALPNLGSNKFLNKVAVAEENVKKLLRSPQHKQAQNARPPPPSNKTSKGSLINVALVIANTIRSVNNMCQKVVR